jgi:hypothetical protein
VDEASGLAYVAFSDRILKVNIDTEAIEALAGPATPGNQFEGISDLLFDEENQRLLVADAVLEAILAVDTATGMQTVFSQAPDTGEGPAFENVNSLTLVAAASSLFVSNQASENIMGVDLSTGDRKIVMQQCLDDSGSNVLTNDETLQQVHYNERRDELLVVGNHLLSYDLETRECSLVFPWIGGRGVLSLTVTPDDQVLATGFGGLIQFDRETGDVVIVSK